MAAFDDEKSGTGITLSKDHLPLAVVSRFGPLREKLKFSFREISKNRNPAKPFSGCCGPQAFIRNCKSRAGFANQEPQSADRPMALIRFEINCRAKAKTPSHASVTQVTAEKPSGGLTWLRHGKFRTNVR
jgi:hypothetical protein